VSKLENFRNSLSRYAVPVVSHAEQVFFRMLLTPHFNNHTLFVVVNNTVYNKIRENSLKEEFACL